jgi:uncharacterized protein YdaU (DUF1376 family)
MSAFPSLPLFTDAWVADTKHLSRLERGTYHDLLVLMWRSPLCRVPSDGVWLSKRLDMTVDEVEKELRPIIAEFCQLDGKWIVQKRLRREWDWCSKNSRKRSAAAKSRWAKEKDVSKSITANEPASTAPNLSSPTEEEEGGGDARATPSPKKEPLVTPEAHALANEIAGIVGHDPECPPVPWYGAPMHVSKWLREGWTREVILVAVRRAAARKRDGPPVSILFFENEIAREVARQAAPLPVVKVADAIEISIGGENGTARNGSNGGFAAPRRGSGFASNAIANARIAREA